MSDTLRKKKPQPSVLKKIERKLGRKRPDLTNFSASYIMGYNSAERTVLAILRKHKGEKL